MVATMLRHVMYTTLRQVHNMQLLPIQVHD
jgi:hypothetical protein